METYHVNILGIRNAEGAMGKVGNGTLTLDDLRDEIVVTGYAVARWANTLLIVLAVLALCPAATGLMAFFTLFGETTSQEATSAAYGLIRLIFPIGVIILYVFRKKIFPKRTVAVRFSREEIGQIERRLKKTKGPVDRSVAIHEANGPVGYYKWAEMLPQSESDAEAIIDGAGKLRDG